MFYKHHFDTKRYFLLFAFLFLQSFQIFSQQSTAIIFTVDGLSFLNTVSGVKIDVADNYLQKAISKMDFGTQGLEIISYSWRRNAEQTDLIVADLKKEMLRAYQRAQTLNKKFIVVSHSWGTFLSYAALLTNQSSLNTIYCDLFITLSSPLGTPYSHQDRMYSMEFPVIDFTNSWKENLKFNECIGCQPNCGKWVNFWAWGDIISGPLQLLDFRVEDIRVDESENKIGEKDSRNTVGALKKWHGYTSLENNPITDKLNQKVKELLCNYLSCSTSENDQATFGFILDSSGSMGENDPRDMRKTAMKAIIDQLNGGEKIFIVDFDDKSAWLNPNNWSDVDKLLLKDNINSINSSGGTNIGGGLSQMRYAIEQTSVLGNKGVILLSDGMGTYNNEAEWFRQRNIPIYTISFIGEDNSKLLSDIAQNTGGIYFKANRSQDIVTAFKQFQNSVNGNATLSVYKSNIKKEQTISHKFFVEKYATYILLMLVWDGSTIGLTLKSPDGNVYSYQNPNTNWAIGSNYSSVRIDEPASGEWEAEFYGVDIPPAGEDFVFNVSADSKLHVRLDDNVLANGRFNFSLSANEQLGNVMPIIVVTTPTNKDYDISKQFNNGNLNYMPRDGRGNYNFNFDFRGKYFQRNFVRSMFIGEYLPTNIAPIKRIEGNYLFADLGRDIGNEEGTKFYVLNSSNQRIAEGTVINVKESECTAEQMIEHINENITTNHFIELDIHQWSGDNVSVSQNKVVAPPQGSQSKRIDLRTSIPITKSSLNQKLTNTNSISPLNNFGVVKLVEGSTIFVSLPNASSKLIGRKCIFYRKNNRVRNKIARGVVNYVSNNECTVEVEFKYNDLEISTGDYVEFDKE